MSNTFAPFGYSQVGGNAGAAPNFEQAAYPILYSDTDKIYTGDPVKIGSNGYIAAWTAGTGVSQLFGIFAGCQYLSTSQSRVVWSPYWPGADVASGAQSSLVGYVVPVSPGSAPRFLVQTGNSSTTAVAVTQAYVGQNSDVAMGTGNTLNGRSGAYLDINTFGATATLPFRIIGLYQGVGNGSDATSANNWVIVSANTLQTTGI
jgi:hypothetical protein